jgi:hypothetical protein
MDKLQTGAVPTGYMLGAEWECAFLANPPMQAYHHAVAVDIHESVIYMATFLKLFQKSQVFSVF